MKRKSILTVLVLLVLFAFVSCASVEKTDVKNMTDEQVLALMESRGFNIYAPRFRVIYNDRLIYGPNFQEDYMPSLEETLAETQTVELVDETSEPKSTEPILKEEKLIEDPVSELVDNVVSEETIEEIIFNEPIEYDIPDYAFVSEGFEEEFDILAQWEAYLAEEDLLDTIITSEEENLSNVAEPENQEASLFSETATETEVEPEVVENTTESIEFIEPVAEESLEEETTEEKGTVITLYEEQQTVVEPFIPSPYPIMNEQAETETQELADVEENIGVYTPLDWIMYVVLPIGAALVCLICAIVKKHNRRNNKKQ